jgi:hypothetical protein
MGEAPSTPHACSVNKLVALQSASWYQLKSVQLVGNMKRKLFIIQTVVLLAFPVAQVGAFSLLGPYASWMTPTLGYQQPDDIGGPMDINEEYRWNVPVVTYAFDQSFLDYFGSNGVAAVEQAIGVINDLPPASSIVLTNFTTESPRFNPSASSQYDLATATLSLLLEQMGLAQSTRYVFTMRRFDWNYFCPTSGVYAGDEQTWPRGTIPEYILERNFDPETLTPSHWVNGELYSAYIQAYGVRYSSLEFVDAVEIPIDISVNAFRYTPVAANASGEGVFWQGLTQDDVGGLRYLLASNNVNFEVLLPDVHEAGTNAASFVNGALRPGIEKLAFIRQEYDSTLGRTTPVTNVFTDTYFTNGMAMHQQVQRVITEPDFLFCATNTGEHYPWVPMTVRTGTENWWNSAPATGSTNNGPGVIRPPIRIAFNKSAVDVETSDAYSDVSIGSISWASFDETTIAPVVYPCATAPPDIPMKLRLHLVTAGFPQEYKASYQWQLPLPLGGLAALQFSTNLTDWASCAVVTNQGMAVEWSHQCSWGTQRFFRILPQ